MNKERHEGEVGLDGKGFRKKIGQIVDSLAPGDGEVVQAYSVSDPMVSHFDTFGALGFHGVVGDAVGALIITQHDSGWLRVAEG